MDESQSKSWVEGYIQALEAKNAKAVVALFSENGTYEIVDPFKEWTDYGLILRGRSEYCEWLEGFFESFKQWRFFEHEILSATTGQAIIHIRAYWDNVSSNEQLGCDMVHLVTLDSNNLCTYLRDWSRVRSKG